MFDPLHFLSHEGVPAEAFDDPAGFYKENWKDFPALDPHPLFDQEYYLSQLTETPEVSPLQHYLSCSDSLKPNPNIFFDQSFYETTQMAAAKEKGQISALEHFTTFFYADHCSQPSPAFDSHYFKRHNPDLIETKLNPLELLRFDSTSGLRIYGKTITNRLINAFSLEEGPRRGHHRPMRYILLVTSELEDYEPLERLLTSLSTNKAAKSAEIIAISVPAHLEQIEHRLGRTAVSDTRDIIDKKGVLSEAALALNLKCMVSPFKTNVIISNLALSNRLLFGARNITFEDTDEIHVRDPAPTPAKTSLPKVIIPISDWQISGVNTWVTNISEGLSALGFDVELLCCRDFYRFTSSMELPTGKLKLIQAPMSKAPLWWAAVSDYAHSQRNAVFLTAYDFRFNAMASVLPTNLPMIGVIHSDDPTYYRACEHLGGFWHHIITVSDHICAELRKKHPQWSEKISSVHYGIQRWEGDLPAPPGTKEPLRIIYTGRIVHQQKRLLDLPQLLQELDARKVDFQLDLIGEGCDEDELRSLLKNWINRGIVIMHGRRSSGEIDCLLAQAHVFLLISDYEGLPLSLLEAMAHGVVPVVSDIHSGIPEVVHHGKTGYRAPIGDYLGFAEIIAHLGTSTDEWESVSRSTQEFFKTQLTREVMSQKTAEIILTVADPKNRESFQYTPLSPEILANRSDTFGDIILNITQP